jgi:DNA-binding beta-propeller fold protein YncE
MSCSFLPPIRADIISGHRGDGGIALNVDGTLVASVDNFQHCVYICNVADRTSDPFVVGTRHTSGSAHEQLHSPVAVCFVHRDGIDTLLISDSGNNRVVEVTARGEFMRAIAVDGCLWGIAERDGVIAVSLCAAHTVVLLQYESGAVRPDVTIGTCGNADGQLWRPWGVAFTADGRYILVADFMNHRVSKFNAASGAFVAHAATQAANWISYPTDVLQCEDDSIVVTSDNGSVVCVGKDGVTVQDITIPSGGPSSLSCSPSLNGVVVKGNDGGVFVLRDAWSHSLRCEWVQACVRV